MSQTFPILSPGQQISDRKPRRLELPLCNSRVSSTTRQIKQVPLHVSNVKKWRDHVREEKRQQLIEELGKRWEMHFIEWPDRYRRMSSDDQMANVDFDSRVERLNIPVQSLNAHQQSLNAHQQRASKLHASIGLVRCNFRWRVRYLRALLTKL